LGGGFQRLVGLGGSVVFRGWRSAGFRGFSRGWPLGWRRPWPVMAGWWGWLWGCSGALPVGWMRRLALRRCWGAAGAVPWSPGTFRRRRDCGGVLRLGAGSGRGCRARRPRGLLVLVTRPALSPMAW
jgi:hypothetical protein